ncbi:MAG: HAMP domain-containing protein [Deltaproteobacteria bacterium]|nr:HAMP domain-containing protein [Candidatus Tharpella sp.]
MTLLRSPLLWKIYAIFVAIILLASIIVGSVVGRLIEKRTLNEVRRTLEVRTLLLGRLSLAQLKQKIDPILQSTIKDLGRNTNTRLTLIGVNGLVLADSDKNPATMDNHGRRPEILDSQHHEYGVATRFSETLQTDMMYLARSIRKGQNLFGYARASLPLTLIEQRIDDSRKAIIFAISIITLIALIFGFFLARHFIEPLLEMTGMAEAMADGDFSRRLKSQSRDEIGRLVKAFNLMAEKSQNRIETINTDRSKLNAILTGMSEGVVAVDRDEKVIHMNHAAALLLRAESDKSLGKPIWEVTRLQELCDLLNDACKSDGEIKKSINISYGVREQVVEMHAVPLKNGFGKTVGAMVVLLDVSELRHLETVRRDFVTNASHELKTPITAIRAMVETMIDDSANMSEEIRLSFLNKIANQSLRLSAIIVDLMALSRFELQNDLFMTSVIDLGQVVRYSVQGLTPAAEAKGIILEFFEAEGSLEIVSDEEALDQAVTNILDNAIKYTSSGGHVSTRLYTSGKEAIIEVEDTGIGIEPQDKERIFERFYRVDKARSRGLGGTGLGLAIVRHIVMAHQGRVEVDSRPGIGSTFRLIFPLGKS